MHVETPQVPKAESRLRGCGEQILIVEDNPDLREMLACILEGFNYRVLTASSAEAGLELWGKRSDPIPVVLVDYMLPDTNGLVLARRLQNECPDLKVIFVSGELTREAEQELPREWAFLEKPFMPTAVIRKIRQALGKEI